MVSWRSARKSRQTCVTLDTKNRTLSGKIGKVFITEKVWSKCKRILEYLILKGRIVQSDIFMLRFFNTCKGSQVKVISSEQIGTWGTCTQVKSILQQILNWSFDQSGSSTKSSSMLPNIFISLKITDLDFPRTYQKWLRLRNLTTHSTLPWIHSHNN